MDDLVVVIRSVEERTEQACIDIVRSQVGPDSPVHLVRNKPFAEAHVESMHLAMQSGTRWALFLDADVLLRQDAIPLMLREAEAIAEPFYMLNFRILDRGFGGPAYGVHLYSTKYLETALRYADSAREAQRPETFLCVEMARHAAIPSLRSTQLVGLHGYEQYYTDSYRTTFVRAVKFARHTEYFLRLYRAHYQDDPEFRIMLWSVLDGLVYRAAHSVAPLQKDFYHADSEFALTLFDLCEKTPFNPEGFTVERIIEAHVPDDQYSLIASDICPPQRIAVAVPDRGWRRQLRRTAFGPPRRLKKIVQVALYG